MTALPHARPDLASMRMPALRLAPVSRLPSLSSLQSPMREQRRSEQDLEAFMDAAVRVTRLDGATPTPLTHAQIGALVGVSHGTAYAIEQSALRKVMTQILIEDAIDLCARTRPSSGRSFVSRMQEWSDGD